MYDPYAPRVNPVGFILAIALMALALSMVFTQTAWAQVEEARIVHDGARQFGYDLALSGNRALIAGDDSVFVYERTSVSTWEETGLLTLGDLGPIGIFGGAVALDGERALIKVQPEMQLSASVYIYEYGNGSWIHTGTLDSGVSDEDDGFGFDMTVQGDELFIGATADNEKAHHAGAVYVFKLQDDNTWAMTQKLIASQSSENSYFGSAIAVDGDRMLIGAGQETIGALGYGQGAAYIFELQNDGSWLEATRIFAQDGEHLQYFGRAVALQGDRAVAGVLGANTAYVFDRQSDGAWVQTQKLQPSDGDMSGYDLRDNFGVSLAIEGDRLLVGADNNANYNTTYAGSVYVFEAQADGTYYEAYKLISSDGSFSSDYGTNLAMQNGIALISDIYNMADAGSYGVVYAIDMNEPYKAVTSLTLIDSATDMPVDTQDPMRSSYTIPLHELPLALNVRANVVGDDVQSVKFEFVDDKGQPQTRIENDPPFAMLGDVNGDYAEGRLFLGEQYIRATPYTRSNAEGRAGNSILLHVYTEHYEPPQTVTGFTLINPVANTPYAGYEDMRDDVIISLNLLPPYMNLQAHTTGEKVNGVRFEHLHPDGSTTMRIEHTPPFTLFGDVEGNYAAGEFETGFHSITAVPFTYSGGGGDLDPLTTTFTVTKGDPEIKITRFYLVSIGTGEDIVFLYEDGYLDTAHMDLDPLTRSRGFGVRAEVEGPVESVYFELEPDGYTRVENTAPFALFGDENGAYLDGELQTYVALSLTATPYREADAMGAAGDPYRVHFMLIPGGATRIGTHAGLDELKVLEETTPPAEPATPETFALAQAYPNPFNAMANIQFTLPEREYVQLIVYDMLGREVITLVDETKEAGMHEVPFDAAHLPSGIYLYRLQVPAGSLTGKLLLLK